MKKLLGVFLIWTVTIFIWKLLWSSYSADVFYEKSQHYLATGDVEMANRLIKKAVQKNEFEPNYYRGRAKTSIVSAGYTNGILDEESKRKVLEDLEKAVSLNPDNLVTLRNCIPLYYFLAVKNISVSADIGGVDERYLPITRDYFRQIKSRFSHDAGVVSSVAKYEKRLGLTEDFNGSIEIIKRLRPDLLEWYESFR
jgi:tetratricopeptide (TPR) repeat protein